MRKITDHEHNPCNKALTIEVHDEPGQGGACHKYSLEWRKQNTGRGFRDPETGAWHDACILLFQNGPVNEDGNGVNGITNEALLAVVLDRLRGFQTGEYACRENALAITKIEEAMHWLHSRTRQREARGVEGTHTV